MMKAWAIVYSELVSKPNAHGIVRVYTDPEEAADICGLLMEYSEGMFKVIEVQIMDQGGLAIPLGKLK